MKSASVMSIHIEGDQKVTGIDPTNKQTENQANLYIGSKGERSNYFSGSISNVMIFNQHKTNEQKGQAIQGGSLKSSLLTRNVKQTQRAKPYKAAL